MAHGIYAFLIRIDDPNVDDEVLAKEAASLFVDGFNDRLDENNGYQEECLVLRNGRIVNLASTDDSLYREVARLPQDERYNWARLTALQCVANEFELGGQSPLLVYDGHRTPMDAYWEDFDSLMTQIMSELPPRLAALWAKGPMLPSTDGSHDNLVDRHRRDRWGRQMQLLLRSTEFYERPFSDDGTPYEYRAFDLSRTSDTKSHEAILLVDIHT